MNFVWNTALVWDIALVAVIVICVSASAKRGFIKSSRTILAIILTALLLITMQAPAMNFLHNSPIGEKIRSTVIENVTKTYEKKELPQDADTTDTEKSLAICEAMSLPKFLSHGIEMQIKQMSEIKNNVLDLIADTLSNFIIKVLSVVILFLLVRLFVFILLKILDSLFSLPGLRTVNRTMGAMIGIFNALLMVYIICGAVSLFTPVENLETVQNTVSSTYLVKYFYDNNILLSLFV